MLFITNVLKYGWPTEFFFLYSVAREQVFSRKISPRLIKGCRPLLYDIIKFFRQTNTIFKFC